MSDQFKKDIKLFKDQMTQALRAFTTGNQLDRYGKQVVEIIYNRTKTGKDVNLGKLKDLSTGYKNYRKNLLQGRQDQIKSTRTQRLRELTKSGRKQVKKEKKAAATKTFGEFFSPTRSNLTLTGEMLNALSYRVQGNKITIYVNDNQRDDGQTNAEVALEVTRNGRPFLGLAPKEELILSRTIETDIRKFIRALFSK